MGYDYKRDDTHEDFIRYLKPKRHTLQYCLDVLFLGTILGITKRRGL